MAASPSAAAEESVVAAGPHSPVATVFRASGGVAGAMLGAPIGFSRDGSVTLYAGGHALVVARGAETWHIGGRSPYASLSPDGTQVVLTNFGCVDCDHLDNPNEIFVGDVRTRQIRRLTFNGTYDGEADWSPDGRMLVYTNDFGLATMNARGGERRQLTWHGWSQNPRWSPDGRTIVYHDVADLYLADVASGLTMRLTRNPGPDHNAAWSPDGTRLAYLSLDVCAMCWTAHEPWEVWVMDVRTRKTRRISGKGYGPPVWLPHA